MFTSAHYKAHFRRRLNPFGFVSHI